MDGSPLALFHSHSLCFLKHLINCNPGLGRSVLSSVAVHMITMTSGNVETGSSFRCHIKYCKSDKRKMFFFFKFSTSVSSSYFYFYESFLRKIVFFHFQLCSQLLILRGGVKHKWVQSLALNCKR